VGAQVQDFCYQPGLVGYVCRGDNCSLLVVWCLLSSADCRMSGVAVGGLLFVPGCRVSSIAGCSLVDC
jgi:hypothetical protein